MTNSKTDRLTAAERAEARRALIERMNDWVPPTVISAPPTEAAEGEGHRAPPAEDEPQA